MGILAAIVDKTIASGVSAIHRFATQKSMANQYSELCEEAGSHGLAFGVNADEEVKPDKGILTSAFYKFNKTMRHGRLLELLRMSAVITKQRGVCMFNGDEAARIPYYSSVTVAGLGREYLSYNPYELIDEEKETTPCSISAVCRALAEIDTTRVEEEDRENGESAVEGAALGVWLRHKPKRMRIPIMDLYSTKRIEQNGSALSLTREMPMTPSNLLTTTWFAQTVVDVLCKAGVNIEVKVEGWAIGQSLHASLSLGRASCEQPIFVKLSHYGTCPEDRPIAMFRQGKRYDAGGLCLQKELLHMHGGMTGAAVVVSTTRSIAGLRVPAIIRGLIRLCENVLGSNSFGPGDIVGIMNGMHIKFLTTDQEVLCSKFIVAIANTSGAMHQSLDEAACGAITSSEILWQQFKNASMRPEERVWRLPLWKGRGAFRNYGSGRGGGPFKSAAFLHEFVPCGQWMHIDATNVIVTNANCCAYLRKDIAGLPTQTVVEFIARMICKDNAPQCSKLEMPK